MFALETLKSVWSAISQFGTASNANTASKIQK